jgi:S1-C subfamily serine protease
MKRIFKLIIWIIVLNIKTTFSQSYNYPKCKSQTDPNLTIINITCLENSTIIEFEYTCKTVNGTYIQLYPPKSIGVLFIKANDKIYKLISTNGIGNSEKSTYVKFQNSIKFTATFEAIPKSITHFDLIESGNNTIKWNFFEINLNEKTKDSENCDLIKFLPMSAKPSFEDMLRGVKNAYIVNKAKINGHIPAFNALEMYLKNMGFESVNYISNDILKQSNPCESVLIILEFNYNLEYFYGISITFESFCNKYSWKFTTNKIVKDDIYSNPEIDFGYALRNMYSNSKGYFDNFYTLKLEKNQTCWTENKIKTNFLKNGYDLLEGIYENSGNSEIESKYKIAVRKVNEKYYLIYLSGANNHSNWSEGEIKAILEPTATPTLFKARWVMANKKENINYYVSFENGFLNVISDDKEKQIYVKMFPTINDNKGNKNSEINSSGSGYAVSSNGYIATNYHVTNGAKSIKVRGVNGDFTKVYSAKVIIEDKNNDLAIIKIDDPGFKTLGIIPYVISNKSIDVGSSIFVLGYPLRSSMGEEIKLTNGIISSKSGYQGDITSYQISAPVHPGNSGGPLFDIKGNIIGIINSKHSIAENASYAIKSSYLLALINSIPAPPKLQSINQVSGKTLTEQVKILKKFTYIIEVYY